MNNISINRIDYVMIFLKIIVESNWDAKKLFNSKRVYTWNEFKKFFKNCIDKAKTLYANIYNKWLEYTQYDNQDIRNYNEKRIHYIFILFKTFKFIVEQKLEKFETNLKKQHKRNLKYFFKFVNKIDLITQIKRFENQTKKEKHNNKKNRKHKKNFDIFEFEFEQKNLKAIIIKNKNNKKNDKSKSFRDVNNSNHISIFTKFKNINFISRLFRWIVKKYVDIKVKKSCFECDKCIDFKHNAKKCIDKKKATIFYEKTFDILKS